MSRHDPMLEPEASGGLTEVESDLVPRALTVTSVMAASSLLVLVLAVLRSKVVAVELGPEGIGALTLLVSFVNLVALGFGLGLGSSAIREIAASEAKGEATRTSELRSALYSISFLAAVLAAAATAVLAQPIAGLLGDEGLTGEVRIAALAVGATILGTAAEGDINGLRRYRILATVKPLAALIATLAAVVAWVAGADLFAVVLLGPPLAWAGLMFVAQRGLAHPELSWRGPRSDASRTLIGLGVAFMINGLAAAAGTLLLRVLLEDRLGLVATGEYQAAFAIAAYYVSFVFAALAVDYLPALSALADDVPRLNRAANAQLEVGVLVSAPIVMVLIAAAPVLVPLLYSDAFGQTPDLLRVMLLGELTRVGAWIIGYILVAHRARVLFIVSEVIYNVALLAITAALIPPLGLDGAAIAYLACQLGSFAWTLMFVRRRTQFTLSRTSALTLVSFAAVGAVVYACSVLDGTALRITGWLVVVATAVVAARILARQIPDAWLRLRRVLRLGVGIET